MSRLVTRAGQLALILGLSMSCASTSADRTSNPVIIHHTQDEYRVGTSQHRTWFEPDEYRKEMAAIEDRWEAGGVPPHVVAVYKVKLKTTYRMRYAMEKDVREKISSYYCVGVQLKSDIELKIERGAFTARLQEPSAQREVSVPDEGTLIWYWEGNDQNYYDTARGPCLVQCDLQRPEKSKPIELYIRLPASYQGWTFIGLTLNQERIRVVNE